MAKSSALDETVLGTADQRELEERAIAAWLAPAVRREVEELVVHYRADPQGRTAAGSATVESAAESIAFAAAQQAVLRDPMEPQVMWVVNAAHSWFGLEVPASGYGIDNPDNVHRRVALDPGCRYVVRVRRSVTPPAQQSFIVYEEEEGEGPVTREGTGIAGFLVTDRIEADADGAFEITLDSSPADGRPHHIQLNPRATRLVVRDALAEWATQLPTEVSIERVGGRARRRTPELTDAEATAATLARIGRYWVRYDNEMVYGAKPRNGLVQPTPRPFGASTASHFTLDAGDSLLVTLDPVGADYVGFQVTDPWGVCREYVDRTGGLNNRQARPNPDGTLTYVVGPDDPGVWNWVDTDGLTAGMLALRWQGGTIAPDATPVRDCGVVPTADVPALVAPTLLAGPAERIGQLERRAADYRRRLAAVSQ